MVDADNAIVTGSAGFNQTSLADALKNIIDAIFAPKVTAPLAPAVDSASANGGFGVLSKQNIVNGDTQKSGSAIGRFSSQPGRNISFNSLFGIPTIDIETPVSVIPEELGPSATLYEFFGSSQNIAYQLPSVNGVSRFNAQNGGPDDQ